jgi:hypothetical protein
METLSDRSSVPEEIQIPQPAAKMVPVSDAVGGRQEPGDRVSGLKGLCLFGGNEDIEPDSDEE